MHPTSLVTAVATAASLSIVASCGGSPHPTGTPGARTAAPAIALGAPDPNAYPDHPKAPSATLTGLPAVSADGKQVAIAVPFAGGAQVPPSLKLIVIGRDDHVAHEVVIIDPASPEADATARVADANAYLAAQDRASPWTPLVDPIELRSIAADGDRPTTARGGGAEVTYGKGHVTVAVGGTVVVDKAVPEWDAPPGEQIGDFRCTNPGYLRTVYVDAGRRIALLEIDYGGTDTCWEPIPTHHVVAW